MLVLLRLPSARVKLSGRKSRATKLRHCDRPYSTHRIFRISEVYKHYRGEYLPDGSFFEHALVDKFSIPAEKVGEFTEIFLASLQSAKLVEKKDDKYREPVVLVSSNEPDVPFDLKHIRVIYYDVSDPFWGQKLIEKVAENIVSALKNPEEAVFDRALDAKK